MRARTLGLCLAGALALHPRIGHAQSRGSESLAQELVETLGMDSVYTQSVMSGFDQQVRLKPALAAYRPTMEQFIAKYMSWSAMAPKFAKLYADAFTEAELRDLIAFYRTPTGKKSSRKTPELIAAGGALGQEVLQAHSAELQEMVEARAKEIQAGAPGPYDRKADAHSAVEGAIAQASSDHKLVLLDFGANWCVDCIVLDTLFHDGTVEPFLNQNFHLVRIDVGQWDHNLDIAKQYGDPIDSGIPAVVVLSPGGKILATTKDGALANARTSTAREILDYLKGVVARKQ